MSTGNWFFLRRIDLLEEEQLSLLAECLISIKDGIQETSQRIAINGKQVNLNKNARIFMSIDNLAQAELPARLVGQLRPVWVAAPDRSALLTIYLQSKCVSNAEVGRIMKFLG